MLVVYFSSVVALVLATAAFVAAVSLLVVYFSSVVVLAAVVSAVAVTVAVAVGVVLSLLVVYFSSVLAALAVVSLTRLLSVAYLVTFLAWVGSSLMDPSPLFLPLL